MSYLALTDADREAMLEAIGVATVEELFADLPAGVRLGRELELAPAMSEQELNAYFESLAAENAHVGEELSFLGAGMYDHYVPAIVDAVLQRGEFLTAYTPYQPELSQGVLQAIFEYQTAICELTGMDVSNASGYDGTTVAADACFIAKHATGRSKVVVTEATNPQVRQVVKTYAPGLRPRGRRGAAPRRRDRPGRAARGRDRRGLRDLPAPELLRRARAGARARRRRERRRGAAGRPRRPALARRARGARQLRLCDRDRRGAVGGELPLLRRAALRLPGGALRLHPPDARPDRRRDHRRRREPRLRPHPPDARAAHPAREGDLEHHDQPDAARAGRARLPVVARAGGPARGRRTCMALAEHAKERLGLPLAFADRPTFKEFAVRVGRPAQEVVRAARERGVHPGYALGRDYAGWTTCCWSRVTERRTPEEIERLAEVLGRREADLREVAPRPPRRPAAAARPARPRASRRACARRAAAPARARRAGPRCATSPSSRRATSGSTPASTRSAPAR